RNSGRQYAGEIRDLLELGNRALALIGPDAVANGGQICNQIFLLLLGQFEVELLIEVIDHLAIAVEAAVVKIRPVEICVQQGRRLIQASRSNIVLLVIDKCRRRNVTAGAAQRRIVRKGLIEEHFAAPFRLTRRAVQFAARSEARVGQEIDVLDIGNHGIKYYGRRFRTGEFRDNDVTNKISQRFSPPIVSIWSEISRAAQTWNPDRIKHEVVGCWIET